MRARACATILLTHAIWLQLVRNLLRASNEADGAYSLAVAFRGIPRLNDKAAICRPGHRRGEEGV